MKIIKMMDKTGVKPLKKNISLSLDEDIIEQIRDLAEKRDRSVSQYVNLVLKAYLKKEKSTEEDNKI